MRRGIFSLWMYLFKQERGVKYSDMAYVPTLGYSPVLHVNLGRHRTTTEKTGKIKTGNYGNRGDCMGVEKQCAIPRMCMVWV